jgi:uncharacterized membrane protein
MSFPAPSCLHRMTQTTTSPAATSSTTVRSTGRGANVALWVLQVLLAAVYVFAAIPKLTADPMAVAGFEMMGLGTTGMYIIGCLEVAGAVALLIPRLTGLAGFCFVALMIGAVISTVIFMGVEMAIVPAVVLVLAAVVAYGRRRSVGELVTTARRIVHR